MISLFQKSTKTRFWFVVAADLVMLACVLIFENDVTSGIFFTIVLYLAVTAVLNLVENWPYKSK